MQRIRIRAKVALSLALPLVALLVMSAFEVRQAANDVSHVRSETQLATAVTGPAGIITQLQNERTWASLELTDLVSSTGVPVEGYDETRELTDRAIRAFRDDVTSKGGAVEATFGGALEALDELGEIRNDIDAFTAPRDIANMPFSSQIYDRYADLVQRLLDANAQVTGQVRDNDLRQGTDLAVLATQLNENEANLGRQTATAATLTPNGIDTMEEVATVSSQLAAFDRVNERIVGTTGRYADVVRDRFPGELVEQIRAITENAIDTGDLDVQAYVDVVDVPPEEGFPGLRDALFEEVTSRADTLNDQATRRQWLFVILAVVALTVATTLTLLVSWTITAPMRSLTRQAREMAQQRLPGAVRQILETPPGEDVRVAPVQPVEIETRDEVSDVVAALNTVQDSALDLAVGQAMLRRNIADSFVNLGRRNQNLLGRQLDFITELETNETDPDTLAGLFRLDHLATRMRRNAESLLVLAGIDPPRKWAAPVPITNTMRAALGEVEDYQRVRVDGAEPATILGSVAADLAHLLAELVENSLTFSPPFADVIIRGRWRHPDYRLTVVDEGVGMSPEAIAQANVRLAGSESVTVAPSKYLGHHVAGSLAARHGIRIQLEPGAVRGIVAVVDVPSSLTASPDAHPTANLDWAQDRSIGDGSQVATAPAALAPAPAALPAQSAVATAPRPAFPAAAPTAPPAWQTTPPFPTATPPSGHALPTLSPPPAAPPPAAPPPRIPVVPPRDDLLAALESHAQVIQSRRFPNTGPVAPEPVVERTGEHDLPRRLPGAHLPPTQPARLRPYQEPGVARRDGDRRGLARRGGPDRADEVYSFLSGFSAGVQRGLDEARGEENEDEKP